VPPSLLDATDLAVVRAAAAGRAGPAAVVASCLVEGGVLAYAPDEPGWRDRDRLVVASREVAAVFAGADCAEPVLVEGGRALAVAAGLAAASTVDGDVFRVFCLLDADVVDDGAVWEAANAARSSTLVAVVVGAGAPVRRAGEMFASAGWCTATADADDPVEVMGALDRAYRGGEGGPGVVLAMPV
jgi:hypothetical protein